MKILQKMCLIAMVGVFAGGEVADGMQKPRLLTVDVLAGTKKRVMESYGGSFTIDQIDVTIQKKPKIVRKRLIHEELNYIEIFINSQRSLYFPADWRQPTSEEIVELSYAKVKSEAVTNWYLDQFFKTPKENELGALAEAAGLDLDKAIITFDSDDPSCDRGFQDSVREDFRKLFSLDEGRKLAYRLLIEIYREGGQVEDMGSDFVPADERMNWRRGGRVLRVENSKEGNKFVPMQKGLRTSYLKTSAGTVVNEQALLFQSEERVKVGKGNEKPRFLSIGHECIHWFHFLRNPVRYNADRSGGATNQSSFFLSSETISSYLYRGLDGADYVERKDTSMWPWHGKVVGSLTEGVRVFYSHEEQLTIFGANCDEIMNSRSLFWGDELSENKLIISYNQTVASAKQIQLRGGQMNDFDFFEDIHVIKRCEWSSKVLDIIPRQQPVTQGYEKRGIGTHLQKTMALQEPAAPRRPTVASYTRRMSATAVTPSKLLPLRD